MSTRREIPILMITDALTISAAWVLYFLFRVRSGLLPVSAEPEFVAPMIVVTLFWILLFFLVGLYRPWYAASRFDELALVFKTVSLGALILFFAIFFDDVGKPTGTNARLLIAVYWGLMLGAAGLGRMFLRTIQRRMLIAGIGTHNTVIVGGGRRALELYDQVMKYPALGYRIVGFVETEKRAGVKQHRGVEVKGRVSDLPEIIERENIREILIALDSADHDQLLHVIAASDGHRVGLKIMPDLYDIISGQARTNQIYGFPLIEITPQLMPPWEERMKRFIDFAVAFLVLLLGLPFWLLVALAVKLESPGPALYVQERCGKDGAPFNILKFRSMRTDAEKQGPQWAGKKDPRVTRLGKILRQLHIDEIPQMINVLKGDMSLIGPRPERPVFVKKLSEEIPLYMRRLRVRPGITGWAQVKHVYDESIDDVRKKVEYDLYYIENMSLRMDFKIALSTMYHMLLGRGR
jgi:exopolysaccharide biosynthesis polyprenyl glycosylphosphotransferase